MKETYQDIKSQPSTQEKIFTERVKLLHQNLFVSIPANLVCAGLVFLGLQVLAETAISVWFTAVICISFVRIIGYYFYTRCPQQVSLHLFIFIFGMALSAILWGIAGSILIPEDNLIQQMLIITVIAGITAGGSQTLNPNLPASILNIILILSPLCVWLLSQSDRTYLILGITMSTYLFFMLITAVRGCKLLEKALALHYENLKLFENLSVSNQQLLLSYKKLKKHEHNMVIINKMNDKLQTAVDTHDAHTVIIYAAKKLFSSFCGGLAIRNTSTHQLHLITQWGEHQILKPVFTVNDCWALLQGHNYFVNDLTKEPLCQHFISPPDASICLPLVNQQGFIGLLVIHTPVKDRLTEYQQQLAANFCEVIALSLNNIILRESLYEQTIRDPLTGLFNRRYMDETLSRELIRAIREGKSLCVAMLDIDYFKDFNDDNGHEAGDEVLKFIGIILKETFRESDIACRYGGEEFLVVLLAADLSVAYLRFQAFREAVKKAHVHFQDQLLPSITLSIGIAEAPSHGTSAKEIIHAADLALYVAKESGRDSVVKFDAVQRDVKRLSSRT